MLWLIGRLRRDYATWERPVQVGVAIAIALLLSLCGALVLAPQEQRQTLLLGLFALVVVTEALVLWCSRRMVAPLTAAQRGYLQGDFDAVLAHLEPLRAAGSADARSLTLLGNTYRQLGRLEDSAAVLSEAVDKSPNHHYPHYGLGRTLVVQGQYSRGLFHILQALEFGAPEGVRFDAAEAYYRMGDLDAFDALLDRLEVKGEPHRELLVADWRSRFRNEPTPNRSVIEAGLPYWNAQAERFARTPYGAAVADDVVRLQLLLKDEVQGDDEEIEP